MSQKVDPDPENLSDRNSYKILNMRTGEVRELESSKEELNSLVTLLVEEKLKNYRDISDEKFLFNARKIKTKIYPELMIENNENN